MPWLQPHTLCCCSVFKKTIMLSLDLPHWKVTSPVLQSSVLQRRSTLDSQSMLCLLLARRMYVFLQQMSAFYSSICTKIMLCELIFLSVSSSTKQKPYPLQPHTALPLTMSTAQMQGATCSLLKNS